MDITKEQKDKLLEGCLFVYGVNDIDPVKEWGKNWFSDHLDGAEVIQNENGFEIEVNFEGDRLGWVNQDGDTRLT